MLFVTYAPAECVPTITLLSVTEISFSSYGSQNNRQLCLASMFKHYPKHDGMLLNFLYLHLFQYTVSLLLKCLFYLVCYLYLCMYVCIHCMCIELKNIF